MLNTIKKSGLLPSYCLYRIMMPLISDNIHWLLVWLLESFTLRRQPEQRLQAHKEAINKYIESRRLNHKASITHAASDPWLWPTVLLLH